MRGRGWGGSSLLPETSSQERCHLPGLLFLFTPLAVGCGGHSLGGGSTLSQVMIAEHFRSFIIQPFSIIPGFAWPAWEALRRVLYHVLPVGGFSARLVARKVSVAGTKRSARF